MKLFLGQQGMQVVLGFPARSYLLASLVVVFLFSSAVSAGSNYHGVLIRSLDPLDYLLLEKIEINGRTELGRLLRDGPLTEKEYKKLAKLSLATIRSFRIVKGRLQIRSWNGSELLALPREFNRWTRTYHTTSAITHSATLSGRLLGREQTFSARLTDGWVVHLLAGRPSQESVAFLLAEARNTEEAWAQFLKRFPRGPNAQRARESLASAYLARTQEALGRYQQALREKKAGYSWLGMARKRFNQLSATKVRTPAVVKTEAILTSLEAGVTKRLERARLLAEKADFAGAEQMLEPLVHFRQEFPELASLLTTIRRMRAQHHVEHARRLLSDARFDQAAGELDEAASYQGLPEIPALRRTIEAKRSTHGQQAEVQQALAEAREAMARKDYARAFETMWPVVTQYPEDAELQREFSSLRELYIQTLLAEATHAEELHTPIRSPADEEALLQLHRQLTRVGQFEPLASVAVWRDRLSMTLADYYRERSQAIAARNGSAPSPLAFAYLQQAHHYAIDKSELPEFAAWRSQIEDELRIGMAFTFRDLTPQASGGYLMAELSTHIGAVIQKAGFPHVELFDLARRPEPQPTLELVVELLHIGVRDTAKTERVSSEYSAGVLQVPNPRWRTAKSTYDEAVKSYEAVRARVDRNRRRSYNTERERRSDNELLARAQAALGKVKKTLDTTPAFVEEEDIRAYEFTRRTVRRVAEIRLAYRWVNAATGVREAQQLLEEKEPVEGVEVTGVHPADKNGHRNQPTGLPDAAALRSRVLRKIQKPLAEHALDYLQSFIERDFERANQEAERGNHEAAAEHYLRFLFNSPRDDKRRSQAFHYLEQQFRFVALGDWLAVADKPY